MGLRQHPEQPSPGRPDGESLPFSSNCRLPETSSPCRNPDPPLGPGTSSCYSTCHPAPPASRGPAVLPSHARAVRSLPRSPDFFLSRHPRLYMAWPWKSIPSAEDFLLRWPGSPGRPIAGLRRLLRPAAVRPPCARRVRCRVLRGWRGSRRSRRVDACSRVPRCRRSDRGGRRRPRPPCVSRRQANGLRLPAARENLRRVRRRRRVRRGSPRCSPRSAPTAKSSSPPNRSPAKSPPTW